jgi:hypothetical protein
VVDPCGEDKDVGAVGVSGIDEVFKPVAAFGCGGEPEPVFGRYSLMTLKNTLAAM